jgi:predicted site-specific integrase-resolvase
MKSQKTYSISEAAELIGCNAQTLYRQCRAGKLGRKIPISVLGTHVFRISEKEIQTIKARKNQGIRRFVENPVKKSGKSSR